MSKRTDSVQIDEVDLLNRQADRMERDGPVPAMALLLRNAAFLAGGGDMSEYEWAKRMERADGRTDDVSVVEVRR